VTGSYFSEDSIAAISSATGGAISVIRISGKAAFSALSKLAQKNFTETENRRLVRAKLFSNDTPIDDALVVRFAAPHSYTGEDMVELHIHGGSFIAQTVMEALLHLRLRQALPGEFSFRAVRNGKLSLTQAQAVSDLISSTNPGAVSLALEKMAGSQNVLIQELAENIRSVAVSAEAGIDFSDQDLDELSLVRLKAKLKPVVETLERLRASYQRGVKLQNGVKAVFLGLPNAGKSSFFNAILGEPRSIVSATAGTTRDVVHEQITLRMPNSPASGVTLRLEDTAGLRRSQHEIEKIGIERSLEAARRADFILFLVDGSHAIEASLSEWTLLSRELSRPKILGVVTKADLCAPDELVKLKSKLGSFSPPIENWVFTSTKTGEGMSASVEAIIHACKDSVGRSPGEVLLTHLDQLSAVEASLEDLKRAEASSEHDLFAADLRHVLRSLGPMIGDTVPDDILGMIFSDFCIGK
jgi:tRNA modification GTPase